MQLYQFKSNDYKDDQGSDYIDINFAVIASNKVG